VTTVFLGERPPELEAFLARRRALGLDGHDEVWEGEYHVAPHAHSDHGIVELEVGVVLRARTHGSGLLATGPFNLGDPDDYRVPDGGLHRQRPGTLYVSTAALVVEVLSPGDETMAKFGFYAGRGVDELLVADPAARTIRLWQRAANGYAEVNESRLLDATAADLVAEIAWP